MKIEKQIALLKALNDMPQSEPHDMWSEVPDEYDLVPRVRDAWGRAPVHSVRVDMLRTLLTFLQAQPGQASDLVHLQLLCPSDSAQCPYYRRPYPSQVECITRMARAGHCLSEALVAAGMSPLFFRLAAETGAEIRHAFEDGLAQAAGWNKPWWDDSVRDLDVLGKSLVSMLTRHTAEDHITCNWK
jgi:hypothetical protein